MTPRTIRIGLIVAAFAFGCSGKKDEAEKQPATPKTGTPVTPSTQPPVTPKTQVPTTTPKTTTLVAEPSPGTGAVQWAARLGGPGADAVRDVAVDDNGNVAVTGYFSSDADFGDGNKVAAQKVDVYVSLYQADGAHLWTATFGGPGEDAGNAVTFDANGNIIVVGLFSGVMMVGESKLTAEGSDDAFFAKFSSDGKPLWAHLLGGSDSDAAHDVVARANGNLLVTGSFKGTVPAPDGPMASKGNEDIFVLELDDNGGLMWIQQFGARVQDFGQRIALDAAENAVVFGEFGGEVSFGGDKLTSVGNQDLFLLKLDPKGKHLWSKRFGGAFNELGLGLAVDPAGNIAITGSYDHEISFGGDTLASQGESDVFVAKFTPDGSHLWSTAFGGPREDIGYGMGADKYGNIVLGGWFWQSVDFGGGPLTANGQNKDAFLIKLSATGEHVWSMRMGDKDHDQLRGIAVNREGRVAAVGIFRFALDIGAVHLESSRKPDDLAPPPDVFVAVFER